MKFIIPARKDSKGLPGKNRILLQHTIEQIPKELEGDVIVTTDDEHIIDELKNTNFKILDRRTELSRDDVSIRDVLENVIEHFNIPNDEEVVMLYLTYPQRTWQDVLNAVKFYRDNNANSLLCRKEIKVHPYLCMYDVDTNRGKQIVKHDMYRRQDYPNCFEISHYVCIFKTFEIKLLNKNMYNDFTVFFPIEERLDVDTMKDLENFYDKSNC